MLGSSRYCHITECNKNKFESQGELYKTVVRPAMMYGAETWAVKKAQEEVRCGRNEDVKMDEWSHQAGHN